MLHELIHGLFYCFPDYAADVVKTIECLERGDLKDRVAKFKKFLDESNYDESVHNDEINAYVLTEKPETIAPDTKILIAALNEEFKKHFGILPADIDKKFINSHLEIRFW